MRFLKKQGDWIYMVAAAAIIVLLINWQPSIRKKSNPALPGRVSFDKERELVDVKATRFIDLLSRLQQRNSGVFSFNVADTSGKELRIRIADAQQGSGLFYDGGPLSPGYLNQLKKEDIEITETGIRLPLHRSGGELLVTVPVLVLYHIGKE
jgi:hypothetical protein